MAAVLTQTRGEPDADGVALAGALESEEQKRARLDKLDAIGQALSKTRDEAIQGRAQSGVELDWHEDEEFYQGIDDANRNEHRSIWHTKPMGQAAPMTQQNTRSTVFPNITGPYCDAAAARIADMLLPSDDRSWAIKPTPIPELVELSKGNVSSDVHKAALNESDGDHALAQSKVATAVQAALDVLNEAKEKAKKAEDRIEEWLIECQYHAGVRQVIEDAARIGCGILKGPVPTMKKSIAFLNGTIRIAESIKPGSKRISPWDFFPDPACGDNVQNGSYTWERDRLTRKQLRDLKKQPQFIAESIDECLREGALYAEETVNRERFTDDRYLNQEVQKRNKFEIWYYHGTMEREDLEAAGVDVSDNADPHLPAMITMVNHRVIRASLNPLDTGSFPYDVMVWRPRANHWTGIGVARQIRTPQRIVTAAARNLMDNAGLGAGPMVVIRQGVLTPADGIMGIAPRKIWLLKEDADEISDVKKGIDTIKIDMVVKELMEIVQFGLKLAEDVTSLPMLLQGQQGKAPDTVGGMVMLTNNASSVLRRLARLFDDRVTEPHIRRYYQWLLQYGNDEEKGEFQIDARGSSALVERDIQNQEIAAIIKLSEDSRFGIDPKKAATEFLRSRRFDPKAFEFDDQKWQQILENMAKGPANQALSIAQLRAQTEEKLAGFWAHQEQVLLNLKQQFEAAENARDRGLEMWVKELEDTGSKTVTLDQIKAKLADTTIRTETQKVLSREDKAHETKTQLALTPPSEPAGKAPAGEAFER